MQPIQHLRTILQNPLYQDKLYHLALRRTEFIIHDTKFIFSNSNSLFFLQRESPRFAQPTVLNLNDRWQITKYENTEEANHAIGVLVELTLRFQ